MDLPELKKDAVATMAEKSQQWQAEKSQQWQTELGRRSRVTEK